MPRVRKEKTKKPSVSLDEFSKRLCTKNNELLEGMLLGIDRGELELEIDDGIEYAETIIEHWCDTQRPNRQQHLQMISALFVVMLAEELLTEDLSEDEPEPEHAPEKGQRPGFPELTIEVLRTVRAIWGIGSAAKQS